MDLDIGDESTISQVPVEYVPIPSPNDFEPDPRQAAEDSDDDDVYEDPVELIREFGNNPLMERYVYDISSS
jgi:hypothetical protein